MKVTLLGSGTSSGVPRIDGDWGACDPTEPRNRRRRVSILVENGATSILVDTSPDLREQLLEAKAGRPTAVFWTHEHADHCHGIADLRPFVFRGDGAIPGFARRRMYDELRLRFAFAVDGNQEYAPFVRLSLLPDVLTLGSIAVHCVDLPHGQTTSAGIRFGADGKSIVYTTDFNGLPDDTKALINGCSLWIVDAVRRRPHPTHPHLAQVLEWVGELHPAMTVLTHMDQSMDYRTLRAELPDNVIPGHDGLVISP